MRTVTPMERARANRRRGVMLVECLVYLALFVLVLGVAFSAFYRCWDNSLGLRRTTDDITGALRAGEGWRADVRAATAPLKLEDSSGEPVLRIPHGADEIRYRCSEGALWRSGGTNADWRQVLAGVKSSHMQPEPRQRVTAWRWELELNARRKSVRLKPLFTFESVPPPAQNP